MKTKKVVVGTMTAALLSLSLSSLPVSYAAGETVQISVGSTTAEPGGEFSVDVMLTDIPSAGIQACDFAVQYDSSLLSVTSVSAGALTKTGADEADSTSSMVPLFDSEIHSDEGTVDLIWTTVLDDAEYWLQGSGVFCTITGTVSSDAVSGSEAELKIVARSQETYPGSGTANTKINAGYSNGTDIIRYDVSTADGTVSIGSAATGLKGDVDLNGTVEIADAVKIMCSITDPDNTSLEPQGRLNGDVYQTGDGLSVQDALQIQKYLAQIITEL